MKLNRFGWKFYLNIRFLLLSYAQVEREINEFIIHIIQKQWSQKAFFRRPLAWNQKCFRVSPKTSLGKVHPHNTQVILNLLCWIYSDSSEIFMRHVWFKDKGLICDFTKIWHFRCIDEILKCCSKLRRWIFNHRNKKLLRKNQSKLLLSIP